MQEQLENIGLSTNEAKIYIALSQTGMSTAYNVAKNSSIFKANAYGALKKLVERGLVSKKIIDNKTFYEASDPSFLLDLLDSKKEQINQIIPSLRMLQRAVQTETQVNVYKGTNAIGSLLHHMLELNDSLLIYGAPKEVYPLMKHRIDPFHKKRIKKKIKMYHIYNHEAFERVKVLKKMPYTPIRKLPKLFDTKVMTVICGDEVWFTTWDPLPPKAIHIKDKEMAKAYKNYFWVLWKQAKKFG
jgi:sugar-specific transcriptional regulator TrmB